MSKLDDLINKLCPNGVEYKTLGEVVEFRAGWGFPETEQGLTEGKYPFYKVGDMNNSEMFMDTANNYISEDTSKKLKCKPAPKGTIIFPKIGATMNTNKKRILTKESCYDNNVMGIIAKSINDRFLYYFFSQYRLIDFAKGTGAVPSLDTNRLKSLQIPVPPLPVQEEIVRILDTFTSLTAELTAELTARRKQYEYYRDSLLTRETKVEVKKLGDIATITRGGNFQKKDFVESGLPCIHYGQMYTHFGTWTDKTLTFVDKDVFDKSKQAQPNDIVMAVTSENVDDVCKCTAWVGKEPIAVSGHTAIIHHNQNAKYLSYYFQSSVFYKQKVKLAHGTKVIEVTPDKLNDITIPLPSLDVQERIVNVLDNFDSICTDLKIGLPAEIEAGKKQYEYYRDKLLSFEIKKNGVNK